MEDLFPILLFVIFVLGPIIEALKKKGQRPEPPERTRTQPRPPQQQRLPQSRAPQPTSRTEEVSSRPRAEESAATMVPDDLWEILTGQKRPPVLTTPPPAPPERKPHWDVVYDPEADDDEEGAAEVAGREDVNVEVRRSRVEAQSLESLERHHPAPVIISLEDNIPGGKARHAAFHQKIGTPVPIVNRPARHARLGLNSQAELRRAFLLKEVLGPPKGLEGLE